MIQIKKMLTRTSMVAYFLGEKIYTAETPIYLFNVIDSLGIGGMKLLIDIFTYFSILMFGSRKELLWKERLAIFSINIIIFSISILLKRHSH
jgi:hypothetical protein